jgi:hypothetical protein
VTRLASAVRLEVTLQVRQRFLHAAVFSGLIWLAVLLPMPHHLRPVAEPYILLGDLAIIGFFFVGGSVFFEKQERTLGAVISTPLRSGNTWPPNWLSCWGLHWSSRSSWSRLRTGSPTIWRRCWRAWCSQRC